MEHNAGFRIRPAILSDAERILEIYGYYILNTAVTFEYEIPTAEEFRSRMRKTMARYPYLVAERDGRILGYAYARALIERPACDWACETTVYLDHTARKCGLGRALYSALEAALRDMGIINLYASIAYPETEDEYLTRNSAAFHAHMGFREVGLFRNCGCKFGRWYHLIWVEKLIGEHTPNPEPIRAYQKP